MYMYYMYYLYNTPLMGFQVPVCRVGCAPILGTFLE